MDLNRYLLDHFWDDQNGGLFFTADNSEELLVRRKELYDGAVPSGNSVAMLNLLRLGRITANTEFEEKAMKLPSAFSGNMNDAPSAYTQLMMGIDFALGPSQEIVIAGASDSADTKKMLDAIRSKFLPNKVVLLHPSGKKGAEIERIASFVKNQTSVGGKATAYVCQNYVC